MTEEHKQKIREGVLRRQAQRLAAATTPDPDDVIAPTPELAIGPDPHTPTTTVKPVTEPSPDPFTRWLKTPEGWSCADPRVPQDRVRFAVHLEDVLKKAFNAGVREGEI